MGNIIASLPRLISFHCHIANDSQSKRANNWEIAGYDPAGPQEEPLPAFRARIPVPCLQAEETSRVPIIAQSKAV
jgi:hypothetical protein